MDFMTGNLSYQIEHHIFPDLPSNRYHEISLRVKALCEKYDLPYTTGPPRGAVLEVVADHRQAVVAGQVPHRHP